jgi:hypothetical protein
MSIFGKQYQRCPSCDTQWYGGGGQIESDKLAVVERDNEDPILTFECRKCNAHWTGVPLTGERTSYSGNVLRKA